MGSLIFCWMKNFFFFWTPTCTHHKLVKAYEFTCIQLGFLNITKTSQWESLEHLYCIPKDYSFPLRIRWFFASRCVLSCCEASEFSRLMCSKCHLIKGIAANGSFTLHRFNYLNEVPSKKSTFLPVRSIFCDCVFRLIFLKLNFISVYIFFFLIEINLPSCFILENTWNRTIISKKQLWNCKYNYDTYFFNYRYK